MQLLLMLCFSDSLIFVCCMFKKKMMFHIVEVNDYSRKSYSLKGAIFGYSVSWMLWSMLSSSFSA